jgi:hypothetical protein
MGSSSAIRLYLILFLFGCIALLAPTELNDLKSIKGSNFEVVKMENIVTP